MLGRVQRSGLSDEGGITIVVLGGCTIRALIENCVIPRQGLERRCRPGFAALRVLNVSMIATSNLTKIESATHHQVSVMVKLTL